MSAAEGTEGATAGSFSSLVSPRPLAGLRASFFHLYGGAAAFGLHFGGRDPARR